MPNHDLLLHLMVILLAARMLGGAALRMGVPPVLGEMVAGIALGPSLLGWIDTGQTLALLAEIGIILLLFDVGANTDVRNLLHAGRRSVVLAGTGFVLPLVGGFAVSRWGFHLPSPVAWYIGGTLTATSIGVTVRILEDLGRGRSPEAQIVLGAAVMDDILGVLLLALLYEFIQNGDLSLGHSMHLALLVLIFAAFAPVGARLVALVIERFNEARHRPGLIPICILALVLFFAWLARRAGAPELLGGFAAGLALSGHFRFPRRLLIPHEMRFDRQVRRHMQPIVQIFAPLFFVSVGLSLDLSQVGWTSAFVWTFAAALLVVAVAGKLVGGLVLPEPSRVRWASGLAMVPRGEVGLIFAELGRRSDILDQDAYAVLLIIIAATTLVTPFVLKGFYGTGAPRADTPS